MWGYTDYDPNLVEVHVSALRRKLGEPRLVHTVRGLGYVLRVRRPVRRRRAARCGGPRCRRVTAPLPRSRRAPAAPVALRTVSLRRRVTALTLAVLAAVLLLVAS